MFLKINVEVITSVKPDEVSIELMSIAFELRFRSPLHTARNTPIL